MQVDDEDDECCDYSSLDEEHDNVDKAFAITESSNFESIRLEIVERAFTTLSADAQRGDNELLRSDVNRVYFRRQLSVAECMAVEEKILKAGYEIIEEDIAADGTFLPNTNLTHRFLSEIEEINYGRKIQLELRLTDDIQNLDSEYMDRIRNDAKQARNAFVASNLRYVEQLARRMGTHQHMSLEDLMQEGFMGLLHAADMYDPERGFRFKTYATWWIEQYMRRAAVYFDRIIRLPVHIHDKMLQIRKAKAKLKLAQGRTPTSDELATAVGMEPEKFMKFLWRIQTTDCAEGDAFIGDQDTLFSLLADSAESSFDIVAFQELQVQLRELLASLTPKEARIVQMRFGLDLDQDYTLESIAKEYNLTRERIRQIEEKALNKLRHPTRICKLTGYLDS